MNATQKEKGDCMMDQKELSMEQMEQVNGGVLRIVNTGIEGLDAAVRKEARKSSKQIAHVSNGTIVDTVTDELVYDPAEGRNYVQVKLTDGKTGWIASSILGLPR